MAFVSPQAYKIPRTMIPNRVLCVYVCIRAFIRCVRTLRTFYLYVYVYVCFMCFMRFWILITSLKLRYQKVQSFRGVFEAKWEMVPTAPQLNQPLYNILFLYDGQIRAFGVYGTRRLASA